LLCISWLNGKGKDKKCPNLVIGARIGPDIIEGG